MSFFENFLSKIKQNEADKVFTSQASSLDGLDRRYSLEYETQHKELGKGGYGIVRESRRKSKPNCKENEFATKFICKLSVEDWMKDPSGEPRELNILAKIRHQNLPEVFGVFENESYYQLILQKCDGITLWELIDRNKLLAENITYIVFKQVLDCISYLHSHKILHNDLKDENVMVAEDLNIKIIDFGSATPDDGTKTLKYCGSEAYTSPEVLAGKKYCRKIQEIWSLGVLLYVMMLGEPPFQDVVRAQVCNLIIPNNISKDGDQLLREILKKNPEERLQISQIVNHNWMISNQRREPDLTNVKFC